MSKSIKTHFSFDLPVKASRIKRPRKYSDVTIIKPSGQKVVVAPGRPRHMNDWEPDETIKK